MSASCRSRRWTAACARSWANTPRCASTARKTPCRTFWTWASAASRWAVTGKMCSPYGASAAASWRQGRKSPDSCKFLTDAVKNFVRGKRILAGAMKHYRMIERSIIKKYRDELWKLFVYAVKKYEPTRSSTDTISYNCYSVIRWIHYHILLSRCFFRVPYKFSLQCAEQREHRFARRNHPIAAWTLLQSADLSASPAACQASWVLAKSEHKHKQIFAPNYSEPRTAKCRAGVCGDSVRLSVTWHLKMELSQVRESSEEVGFSTFSAKCCTSVFWW